MTGINDVAPLAAIESSTHIIFPESNVTRCGMDPIVRERIARNKAIAIAKRSAKERTAKNKATAIAKRVVRARTPPGTSRWPLMRILV